MIKKLLAGIIMLYVMLSLIIVSIIILLFWFGNDCPWYLPIGFQVCIFYCLASCKRMFIYAVNILQLIEDSIVYVFKEIP